MEKLILLHIENRAVEADHNRRHFEHMMRTAEDGALRNANELESCKAELEAYKQALGRIATCIKDQPEAAQGVPTADAFEAFWERIKPKGSE